MSRDDVPFLFGQLGNYCLEDGVLLSALACTSSINITGRKVLRKCRVEYCYFCDVYVLDKAIRLGKSCV